jgi:hypothetical protein
LWQRVPEELLDACADEFGVRDRLAAWRAVKLPRLVQVLLSALVIVADWITSILICFRILSRCRCGWRAGWGQQPALVGR